MTFYERIENQGTQTLAVWMFIELLARMCNVLRLGSEVCNWLPASYLEKKEYSLHSAFCTQPAFYSQSAVCILHSVCILPLVRSLQSAVRSLHFTLIDYELLMSLRWLYSRFRLHNISLSPKCKWVALWSNMANKLTTCKWPRLFFVDWCSPPNKLTTCNWPRLLLVDW